MSTVSISSQLLDLNSTIERIEAGEFLIIAADEELLTQLPSGNWIGGTIPYFMGEEGGLVSKEHIFVNTIVLIEICRNVSGSLNSRHTIGCRNNCNRSNEVYLLAVVFDGIVQEIQEVHQPTHIKVI